MTDLHFPIATLPQDLFISKLPNGEKEFFCFICVQDLEQAQHFSWRITSGTTGDTLLAGERPVTDREREKCRVSISAILPSEFQAGELTVEFASHSANWPIRPFVQKNRFRLPLDGQVLVLTAHRIGEGHRSAQIVSQHFAWDLLPLLDDGLRLLHGPLSQDLKAHDFSGFGQPVLAPGQGTIVRALDGMPDLTQVGELPANMDYYLEDLTRALGNHVILDHGNGIWSLLAHLKNGSVRVEEGQAVKISDKLGELGSSGFGSGPHLHLQFMNGPDLLTASPLPVELELEGGTYAPQAGEITSSL